MSVIVGQQLRQARHAKELSLEQVSRATHIRVQYLEALEAGKLSALPSAAQARGFLRTYAGHLNLDPGPLLEGLKSREPGSKPRKEQPAEASPSPAEEPGTPEALFIEIGRAVREHRELLGITLLDVERQTHLRMHYLEALEAGDLAALPSPVQGRGMLNNYASFLGLDPDPLLLKFAEGLQLQHAARRARGSRIETSPRGSAPTRPGGAALSLRRLLSADFLFGSLVVVGLLFFVVWGAIRISSIQSQQAPSATAPAIVDVLLPSPTATLTPTPGEVPTQSTAEPSPQTGSAGNGAFTPTPAVVLPVFSEDAVQIYIVARQRAWMRVTVDEEVQFEGRVIPGSAYPFSGQDSVTVLTGSGSALQIFYNQQDLGPMGLFGEVVERIFTPDGILLPTATITPTPTVTNTPEATETGTPEPSPTP